MEKEIKEEIVVPPYSREHLLKDLYRCFDKFIDCESLVPGLINDLFRCKDEYLINYLYEDDGDNFQFTEYIFFYNERPITYINYISNIIEDLIYLAGTLIVRNNVYKEHVIYILCKIYEELTNIHAITSNVGLYYKAAYEYGDEDEKSKFDTYIKVFSAIAKAISELEVILDRLFKLDFRQLCNNSLYHISPITKKYYKPYKVLTILCSKILLLDEEDMLFPYKSILLDFIHDISNEMYFSVGSYYFSTVPDDEFDNKIYLSNLLNNFKDRYAKLKKCKVNRKSIEKVFKNIEDNKPKISEFDIEIFNIFEELEESIRSLVFSY